MDVNSFRASLYFALLTRSAGDKNGIEHFSCGAEFTFASVYSTLQQAAIVRIISNIIEPITTTNIAIAFVNMFPLDTLTFGIELEFICVRPGILFDPEAYPGCPEEHFGAGPAIWEALNRNGIPAMGWEDDWAPVASHSRWRVEDDVLVLSEEEEKQLPEGYTSECIEISSRKLRFFQDDWRRELAAVLQVLREVESRGCRFVTNNTTGLHVHVGFDNGVFVPLRVAKNVFQLCTAFERLIDELHASHRIDLPVEVTERHHCYPLSFFHTYGRDFRPEKGTRSSPLLDRLVNIENAQKYEGLGALFDLCRREIGLDRYMICGHNSTVNFDNLFPDETWRRSAERLTGTIEFRQHTGSLDFLDIMAWTTFVCSLVFYAATTPTASILDLLIRSVDPEYKLDDFLTEMKCPEDVWDHYRNKGEAVIGVLTNGDVQAPGTTFGTPANALIEQNDHECEERASSQAVRAVIERKYTSGLYGINPGMKANLPMSIAAAELKKAFEIVHMNGIDVNSEDGVSQARAQVLAEFAQHYRAGSKFFSRE